MKRAFKAEKKLSLKSRLLGIFVAHAEENEPPTPNVEELIARARKEEKDKLYTKITVLENEIKAYVTRTNSYLTKIEGLEQALEKSSTGDVTKLNAEIKELTAESDKLKKDLETAQAELDNFKKTPPVNEEELKTSIKAEFEKEYSVKLHIEQKKSECKGDIMSVFLDEIKGDTIEDVDATIEALKAKTLKAKQEMGIVDDEGNPVVATTSTKTKKPTPPPVNPPFEDKGKGVDVETLSKMDVNSPEYRELRKKLVGAR